MGSSSDWVKLKSIKLVLTASQLWMMRKYTLENAEEAIKDGQSRELNDIVHIWTFVSVISHHKY
jgi:hypothetical protein